MRLIQPLKETSTRNILVEVKSGQCIRLTIPLQSMCQLSRKCRIPDISQPYGHPWPAKGIAVLVYFNNILPCHYPITRKFYPLNCSCDFFMYGKVCPLVFTSIPISIEKYIIQLLSSHLTSCTHTVLLLILLLLLSNNFSTDFSHTKFQIS